jgi:predicted TIM-barrel fold metal-dependent hydrolase
MTIAIEDLKGSLVDCDTHLYVPPSQFASAFGEGFVPRFRAIHERLHGKRDVAEYGQGVVLDGDTAWSLKHWDTPAGYGLPERMAALDLMGVDRQLMFPDGMVSTVLSSRMPGAWEAAKRYNDFAQEWASASGGRLRPASMLPLHDVETATAEAERMVRRGTYGFSVVYGEPPGGLSPADKAWDPLWSLLEEAGVPLLLHAGSEGSFLDRRWCRGTSADGRGMGAEGGPFILAMSHLGPEVFISALVMGGALERHPRLSIGVLEYMAGWVGPMAELLDQSAGFFPGALDRTAPLKPSEYVNRQVRVTPFFWEPVHRYIERYGLEDVYVFSTDYPHPEGGVDTVPAMFGSIARVGEAAARKFFVTNGKALLPDL